MVKCYDPQPDFTDFVIPTFWFNRCNGKLFLLKEIDDDGKAIWIDITSGGSGGSGIEKILLDCGEIEPNENNEIIHKGSCGVRTVAEGCKDFCFTLNTDWGLEGGGEVCAGESLTLKIDKTNTNLVTSNVVDGKEGDSVVLDGDNGKVLKKAQQWRIGDGTNSWTGRFNTENKNFDIFPDDKATNPMFTMLPSGVILTQYPTQCSAKLNKTPVFPANKDFETGSNLPFIKIRDEDGYNKNANNFFPGDGQGKYAYYTCPYTGSYNIGWLFLVDRSTTKDPAAEVRFKVVFGPNGKEQSLSYRYFFGNLTFSTINGSIILTLNKGDRIRWNIVIDNIPNGQPYITSLAGPNDIDNFISILFLG